MRANESCLCCLTPPVAAYDRLQLASLVCVEEQSPVTMPGHRRPALMTTAALLVVLLNSGTAAVSAQGALSPLSVTGTFMVYEVL